MKKAVDAALFGGFIVAFFLGVDWISGGIHERTPLQFYSQVFFGNAVGYFVGSRNARSDVQEKDRG